MDELIRRYSMRKVKTKSNIKRDAFTPMISPHSNEHIKYSKNPGKIYSKLKKNLICNEFCVKNIDIQLKKWYHLYE